VIAEAWLPLKVEQLEGDAVFLSALRSPEID